MEIITNVLIFAMMVISGITTIEMWQKGKIFARPRAKFEAWKELSGMKGFIGQLLTCSFCLSFHIAWLLMLIYYFLGILPLFYLTLAGTIAAVYAPPSNPN